jgi:hypothetical protein
MNRRSLAQQVAKLELRRMIEPDAEDDANSRRWVRSHVVGFFAAIGVMLGLVIVDSKIEEIVGPKSMPFFRAVLFVSVLLAGLGARALVAWRSATVDLQGRIFLTVVGLILLTGAAFGMANCRQEIKDHAKPTAEPPVIPSQPAPPVQTPRS